MSKIYINPGHMPGVDPGAVNNNFNVCEADIVLDIGKQLEQYLKAAGHEVIVGQDDNLCGEDEYYYKESICYEANQWPADLFISLHCNAFNKEAHGSEVLYASGRGGYLARYIQEALLETLGTTDRGIKLSPGMMVLKNTNMVAALVEIAFIDNDEDCLLLINQKKAIAKAVCRGILDFINSDGDEE